MSSKPEESKKKVSIAEFKQALSTFKYVLPYKTPFIIGLIFLILGTATFMLVMSIPREVIDTMGKADGLSPRGFTINQLFSALGVVLLLQGVFSYYRVQLFNVVSEKSIADLRKDLYAKLITLDVTFFEKNRVGEISSRLSNDVTQMQQVISTVLAEFLRQIMLLIAGISYLLYLYPKLSLIMLGSFMPIVLLAMYFGKNLRRVMKGRQELLAQSNVIVEESMQGIASVKAYTNEAFEYNRFVNAIAATVKISLKAGVYRGLFAAFIVTALFGALFFVMWRATFLVTSGGDLFQFVIFTTIIGGAIATLGNFYGEIVSAVGATERVREILETPSETTVASNQELVTPINGDILVENLSFSYPGRPDLQILNNISFQVKQGSKVALVGASGSGKTTMFALLQRWYNYEQGLISIDNKDIKDFDLFSLRSQIGVVPQDVFLFGGTIRENIQYGKPNASDEEIIEAAIQANAWHYIEQFPEKLDTIVGERGIKLSGGQRQRIAIARAILKNPKILLLDEATSALDAESEKIVQEALERLMVGRTSIIIAHRLATIRNVDKIIVISKGKIEEQGTHEELIQLDNGIYRSLARLQFND